MENPDVELILVQLSTLLLKQIGAALSDEFDAVFRSDGFRYPPARARLNEIDDYFIRTTFSADPVPLIEQLMRLGYPDYALRAQAFFHEHAPHLL